MEMLGVIGLLVAIIAYYNCSTLSKKIKKMEQFIKERGYVDAEKESLKEILRNSVGSTVKLKLDSEGLIFEIDDKECVIEDVDEEWLLIHMVKKQEEYLLRLEHINGLTIVPAASA